MSIGQRSWWRLRRWIDRALVENRRPASVAVILLPVVIAGLLGAGPVWWSIAAATTLPLLGIVAWRGWRVFHASALKSDRVYDRKTRTLLPPAYRNTNSASRAALRHNSRDF